MNKRKKTTALDYFKKKHFRIRMIAPEEGADNSMLRRVCSEKEIKNIENDFNRFFKIVYDNCLEEKLKENLLFLKENIKQNYFVYMYLLIDYSPARPVLRERGSIRQIYLIDPDDVTKEKMISMATRHLFFLADILIAFVIGDNKTLNRIIKRNEEMTGRKLPESKRKVLSKIIYHRNELKSRGLSSHKYSWRIAIRDVYTNLSEQERKSLLGLELKDKNVDTPRSLTMKNLKTISETISYHQERDNLPK